MQTVRENIVEIVKVPAFMMDKSICENILSILKIAEGTCNIRGCVTKIVSLDDTIEAVLYPFDSDAHFTVRYTCDIFKPSTGNVYNGMVYKSYDEGLLVDIEGYPNIRIMTKQPTTKKPTIGQYVKVKIQDIVFKNSVFTGLGCVVD
jgi:DNA-directed RNA polymerase subunit E'/Rpb7